MRRVYGHETAPRAWLALLPLLLGTFTGTVNNSIVNVPISDILHSFDVPIGLGALVVIAFNLTFAVFMPVTGWLGDRLGRRRVFSAAVTVLAAGAVGAATAPSLGVLVGFRVLQGAATAAILPVVMALIAELVGPERRGRAIGMWAAANGAGQAVGPTLGGLLAGWLGWRAIFWPTVGLAMASLVTALWLVPRGQPRVVPLDWLGALLLTVGAALSLGAISAIPPLGIGSPVVWALALAGTLGLMLYGRLGGYRPHAFLPPRLLREPRYLRASLAAFAQMFCLGATMLGVPLYLIQHQRVTTATAGLLVLMLPLAMAVLAPVAGWATERLTTGVALRVGLGVLILGEALLALQLGAGRAPDGPLVATFAMIGTGVAFVQTPAAAEATHSPAGQLGAGLGLFNLLRFGGSAIGAAWVAMVAGTPPSYGLIFGVATGIAVVGLAGSLIDRCSP